MAINPITGKTNEQVLAESQAAVERAKAMMDQLAAEGNKPFAGSSYDTGYTAPPPPTGGTTGIPTDTKAILDYIASLNLNNKDDYSKDYTDWKTKLAEQEKTYETALSSQQTPEQLFATYSEKLGITQKQEAVQKTEQMLNDLEANINQRISGKGIIEPQRQRMLAVEQRPLQKQLASQTSALMPAQSQLTQLLQLAGQGQTQKLAALKAPVDYSTSMLNTLKDMSNYQTPEQKLQQSMMEQVLKAQIEQQYATPKETSTQVVEINGRKLLVNTQTGQTIQDLGPITTKETTTPTSATGANYNTRLNEEIDNLYKGMYGTTGSREKVIKILKAEFPNVDVAKEIYSRVPDKYEKNIKTYTPSIEEVKITTKSTFQQYKDGGYSRKDIEKQWQADNASGGVVPPISPLVKSILDELFK